MSSTLAAEPLQTVADLLHRLGDIPPRRIRFHPPPGTADESDVLELAERDGVLCELVDGVLVEKTMGFRESYLAMALVQLLRNFVVSRNLGIVTGPDGMMWLFPGLIRIPDVAFVAWDRCPDRKIPQEPVPELTPNFVIEVLSASNTKREMEIKTDEYFSAGVELVWQVDLRTRTVAEYSSASDGVIRDETATLNGSNVLPGFSVLVKDIFAELDRHG